MSNIEGECASHHGDARGTSLSGWIRGHREGARVPTTENSEQWEGTGKGKFLQSSSTITSFH